MATRVLLLTSLLVAGSTFVSAAEAPIALRVSPNGRFLATGAGDPFFYLADTAWELFHRLDRPQADRYLADRAGKGFTVIQAVALAELDGLNAPNAYGHTPLIDNDPTRPAVVDGPANDYWDHVDYIVDRANQLGLVVGLLPTWGDQWNRGKSPHAEIFTPENAFTYGKWIAARYRQKAIIWILGGDRNIESDVQRAVNVAMARGVREGDGGTHLITWHPRGGAGSAQYFHAEPWLDFNMRQNGHVAEYTGRYSKTRDDYDRQPVKPVLDGEPLYEGHPVSFKPSDLGVSIAADVRRPLYWDLFAGACGHTYGHHSVWQMWQADRKPVNSPVMPWDEAIGQPGAGQMQHARRLLESRPYWTRVPDDSVIVTHRVAHYVPGAGIYRFTGTRDTDRSYAMIYAPIGRSFTVAADAVKATRVVAWWFNPRTGEATRQGEYAGGNAIAFTPPAPGEIIDWVLVLDDASRHYPPPGSKAWQGNRLPARE